MATKKTTTKAKEVTDAKVIDPKKALSHAVVSGPRITEKAAKLSEQSMYTLNVARTANKPEIIKAVKTLYGVTPIRVAISITPRKKTFTRGIRGVKGGGKKAIITLKKGDTIAFM